MRYNNGKEVKKIKRLFFQISGLIATAAIILFLFNLTIWGIILIGVFGLWFLFFQTADFQFVEFISENNHIVLRYYKAVTLSRPEYSSIEFNRSLLKSAVFEKSFLGKDTDVSLTIITRKGIADYPSVSLIGVPKAVREKIKTELGGVSSK